MKILAIIPVYNPDMELLRKDIAAFIDGVDKLLIWKNSPLDEVAVTDGETGWIEKIEFCGKEENSGITKALNHAWHYAMENGYSHVLTMDQDSQWEDFSGYLCAISSPQAPKKALFGPYINNRKENPPFTENYFLINSGMLIPVEVLQATEGWREDFFVDAVDMDFIYHAKSLGIPAYRVGKGRLVQRFGNTFKKKLLWKEYTVHNYPPSRLYGIYRNHLIVIRRYPGTRDMKKLYIKENIRQRPIRILLGEQDRWKKICAMTKGIIDGLRYRI